MSTNVRALVTEDEWKVRVDLAAAYRSFYHLGFEYTSFGHLAAKVPGEEAILLNPYGIAFDEVTAANLLKLDSQAEKVLPSPYGTNLAGFNIHAGLLFNRPDLGASMHLHSIDGAAVSCMKEGFIPLCQDGLLVAERIAYHDYEGIVSDPNEAPRMLKDLGDKDILILRNHGTLAVGATIADAFFYLFFLEKACRIQTRALASPEGAMPVSRAIIDGIEGEKQAVLDSAETAGKALDDQLSVVFDVFKRRMMRLHPELAQETLNQGS